MVFPLTVQLVSVAVPPSLYRPPPLFGVLPPVIVSPEIVAVTPPSTWNTRLCSPPLTVTPALGPVIVSVPVVSVSSSWVPVKGDHLRRLEHRFVKGDRLGPTGRIRLADRPSQAAGAAVVKRAGDGERRQQPAVLERQHRRPHPPPLPGLDRSPPASPLIPRSDVTHGSLAPLE